MVAVGHPLDNMVLSVTQTWAIKRHIIGVQDQMNTVLLYEPTFPIGLCGVGRAVRLHVNDADPGSPACETTRLNQCENFQRRLANTDVARSIRA